MARFHNRNGVLIPFTPEEEARRDAEEAQWAIDQAARAAADAQEAAEIDPIRAALAGPDPLTQAQVKRALRYLFKRMT